MTIYEKLHEFGGDPGRILDFRCHGNSAYKVIDQGDVMKIHWWRYNIE